MRLISQNPIGVNYGLKCLLIVQEHYMFILVPPPPQPVPPPPPAEGTSGQQDPGVAMDTDTFEDDL